MPVDFDHSKWERLASGPSGVQWKFSTSGIGSVELMIEDDDYITTSDADRFMDHLGYVPVGRSGGPYLTYRSQRIAPSAKETPYNDNPQAQISSKVPLGRSISNVNDRRISIYEIKLAVEPGTQDDVWAASRGT